MNLTFVIIAVAYVAVTSMILYTLRFLRDRNMPEHEYYVPEQEYHLQEHEYCAERN